MELLVGMLAAWGLITLIWTLVGVVLLPIRRRDNLRLTVVFRGDADQTQLEHRIRGIAFGPGESLDTLYAQRVPIYESWAEITIEADPNRNDIENMVDQIVAALEQRKQSC